MRNQVWKIVFHFIQARRQGVHFWTVTRQIRNYCFCPTPPPPQARVNFCASTRAPAAFTQKQFPTNALQ